MSLPASGALVHEQVRAQAVLRPQAVALRSPGRTLTYSELVTRASRLALHLRARGAGPGTLVALCVERSVDMVVALLAILEAGSAYVPLDPAYPSSRLAVMLEDACPAVLVTESRHLERLPARGNAVVLLDESAALVEGGPVEGGTAEVDGESLAYVIYTSGSTGRPKGVAIPHGALRNFLDSMRVEPGLTESDVVLALTTICFDIAGLEIWLPLTTGALVEIQGRETAVDGRRIAEAVATSGATLMQATPATWRMLLAAGWQGESRLKALCGGESLPRGLAAELLPRVSELWNLYGPTETTVWSTLKRIEDPSQPITIGRPIANTTVHVLDEQCRPVPPGTVGELCIGGAGVARGYLNRPELTAERFIGDPFSEGGSRLYRTGDLARCLPDGELECLGRLDHQVKIRGFRVELGEVEAALADAEGVVQAVAVAHERPDGSKRLVGYVVPRPGQRPTTATLRSHLARGLPDYMIPSDFVFVDRLPLTLNDKVDRRALPPPDLADRPTAAVEPRSPTETRMLALWRTVLQAQRLGVEDDFFDVGGDSVKAAELFARIERELGPRLPLALLLQARTVAALAEIVDRGADQAAWSPLQLLRPAGAKQPFFCVHAVGGNVLQYRPLAGRMDAERPFYGIQARGLDGRLEPWTRIEDMAAAYVAEIRRVQPQGPYLIGGASFGGNVAFEMARLLQAAGEQVALLAVIDSDPVGSRFLPAPSAAPRRGVLWRAGVHWRAIRHGPARLAYVGKRVRRVYRRCVYRIWQVGDAIARAARPGREMPKALRDVQKVNYNALRFYRPDPVPVRVTLFLARDQPQEFAAEKRRGWAQLATAGVDVLVVAGDHLTLVAEPFVAELAQALERCLATAVRTGVL